VLRFRPLAFATFLVWRLRIGACGLGACGFWRLRQQTEIVQKEKSYLKCERLNEVYFSTFKFAAPQISKPMESRNQGGAF